MSHLTDITNLEAPSWPMVQENGRCIYCGHLESEDCICVTCTGVHRGREYRDYSVPTRGQKDKMLTRVLDAIKWLP